MRQKMTELQAKIYIAHPLLPLSLDTVCTTLIAQTGRALRAMYWLTGSLIFSSLHCRLARGKEEKIQQTITSESVMASFVDALGRSKFLKILVVGGAFVGLVWICSLIYCFTKICHDIFKRKKTNSHELEAIESR